jgi:PAS domain S-box-containing protein
MSALTTLEPARTAESFSAAAAGPSTRRRAAASATSVFVAPEPADRVLERYRRAAGAAGAAVWEWDLRSGECAWDAGMRTLLGYSSDAVVQEFAWLRRLVHPDDLAEFDHGLAEAIESHEARWCAEFRVRRAAGTWAHVAASAALDRDYAGRVRRATGVLVDVTDRKEAEAQRRLVQAELGHRMKNTLATVQSLASQTLHCSPSLEAFKGAFLGRLQALAQAHSHVTRREWSSASLDEIVSLALRPFRRDAEQLQATGAPIVIRAQSGLTLTLVLHELATNAAKYGALSSPAGRVDVSWWTLPRDGSPDDRPWVRLTWVESGGPAVAPPRGTGFGTRLITEGVEYELDGVAQVDYRPEGLVCELTFPC